MSTLIERDVAPDQPILVELGDGIPVWKHGPGATPVTSEIVRNLAEDE